jgi:CheY-like chemotaxis protein
LDSAPHGYRLFSAYSGNEGLEMLTQARPDLILLDMQLDDMPGHELAERIRALPEFVAVPIIVISAQEMARVLDTTRATSPCQAVVLNKANGFTTGELVRMIEHASEHIGLPSVGVGGGT